MIATRLHTEPGQEIILDRKAHIYVSEACGIAQVANLLVRTVDAEQGIPTPNQVAEGIAESSQSWPEIGLLSLENTHNKPAA